MTYYTTPYTEPRLHTITTLADVNPWVAFRAACEGGGTPPYWTQHEDDVPELWASPPDAVFRCEEHPRSGASEANVTRQSPSCVVEVMP